MNQNSQKKNKNSAKSPKIPKESKLHREQCIKGVDKNLPEWKNKILLWNEKNLGKIELFIEKMIPFLVIILLLIILAEFGESIAHLFEKMFHLSEEHHTAIIILDYVIIGFFAVDLYFAFFKKATLWRFIKAHFIDIIAIIPVTVFLRAYLAASAIFDSIEAGQKITHVISDVPKVIEATKDIEKIARAEKILKAEESLSKTIKIEQGSTKVIQSAKLFSNIPRTARLFRIRHTINDKKKKIKKKIRELKQKENYKK